jgi:hypothetical protein
VKHSWRDLFVGGPASAQQDGFRIAYEADTTRPERVRVVGTVTNGRPADVFEVSVTAEALNETGKVVATLPIGAGVDGAGYDAASGNAFASNADGTLTVIHQDTPDQYRVVGTLQTPQASRNMGLDPTNHRVFVVSAKFGPAPATGRGRAPVLPDSFSLMVIEDDPAAR